MDYIERKWPDARIIKNRVKCYRVGNEKCVCKSQYFQTGNSKETI